MQRWRLIKLVLKRLESKIFLHPMSCSVAVPRLVCQSDVSLACSQKGCVPPWLCATIKKCATLQGEWNPRYPSRACWRVQMARRGENLGPLPLSLLNPVHKLELLRAVHWASWWGKKDLVYRSQPALREHRGSSQIAKCSREQCLLICVVHGAVFSSPPKAPGLSCFSSLPTLPFFTALLRAILKLESLLSLFFLFFPPSQWLLLRELSSALNRASGRRRGTEALTLLVQAKQKHRPGQNNQNSPPQRTFVIG